MLVLLAVVVFEVFGFKGKSSIRSLVEFLVGSELLSMANKLFILEVFEFRAVRF